MANFQGTTKIGVAGIKKHFVRTEPARAVIELVWNGFDAKAPHVAVELAYNDLKQLSSVSVIDDGEGIDFANIDDNFGRFNESTKQEDVTLHGFNGRGRLAFHRLADRATWYTRHNGKDATILVTGANLKQFSGDTWETGHSHGKVATGSGTRVLLDPVSAPLPELGDMLKLLSAEFGWYLLLNPDRHLIYDGTPVSASAHELVDSSILVEGNDFRVRIIRWRERLASEKSYVYLQNSTGKTVFHKLSSHNNKPGFFVSVYVQSTWADSFASEQDLLDPAAATADSKTWRDVDRLVVGKIREVYEAFLCEHVEREIRKYESEGSFPDFSELPEIDAQWRSRNIRHIVRTVYVADPGLFGSLPKKQRSVLIRLLDRLSVSNENDAIFHVLRSVLDLDAISIKRLASHLERTSFDSIVETIEALQKRQAAVDQIRELMRVHYREVRETPDLQKIIELNTWLFGPQFETLGAEETTFTEIARRLRSRIRDIDKVTDEDVEDDATVEVSQRQPDLFLVRKLPMPDSLGRMQNRWVIVEIKRPGVALNYRHLRQVDEYIRIIEGDPEFAAEQTRVEVVLVGRKISSTDTEIRSRLKQVADRGVSGLIRQDQRFTVFVLNWETILAGFELTNDYLLKHLRLKRAELEGASKDELVHSLLDHLDERAPVSTGDLRRTVRNRKPSKSIYR
ncbi:MAG: ATP-binding protein [Devosia sp.]